MKNQIREDPRIKWGPVTEKDDNIGDPLGIALLAWLVFVFCFCFNVALESLAKWVGLL